MEIIPNFAIELEEVTRSMMQDTEKPLVSNKEALSEKKAQKMTKLLDRMNKINRIKKSKESRQSLISPVVS